MRRAMVEWALRLAWAWAWAWACSGVRRVRRMGTRQEAKRVLLVLSSIDVAVAVGPGGDVAMGRNEQAHRAPRGHWHDGHDCSITLRLHVRGSG
jgi:hypothetical protein